MGDDLFLFFRTNLSQHLGNLFKGTEGTNDKIAFGKKIHSCLVWKINQRKSIFIKLVNDIPCDRSDEIIASHLANMKQELERNNCFKKDKKSERWIKNEDQYKVKYKNITVNGKLS